MTDHMPPKAMRWSGNLTDLAKLAIEAEKTGDDMLALEVMGVLEWLEQHLPGTFDNFGREYVRLHRR